MRKILFLAFFFLLSVRLTAQTIAQKLQQAYQQFQNDNQLKYAISSLYVIDAKTGQVIFDKNSRIGLAPASTQKIITAATAFELLGKDFRYKTELGYFQQYEKGVLERGIAVIASGDPTLGSPRWKNTTDTVLLAKWAADIKKADIKGLEQVIVSGRHPFSGRSIPDGWIWQDIGNYYGAGAGLINWKENQYNITLRSFKQGDRVEIVSAEKNFDKEPQKKYTNELTAGAAGSGDNAYVYYDNVIAGTIPPSQSSFTISAARTNPENDLLCTLSDYISAKTVNRGPQEGIYKSSKTEMPALGNIISTHLSPPLDSIIYWFLQKSINLYGEALVKTFSAEKIKYGSTDSGVVIIKDFWKQKGLDENELNISDGSGLSPQNRVTTHAQAEILRYAKKQSWFPSFYNALPEYNNMKMKSGTIGDVKGYCGYHRSKDGKEYIFSFLVNNYNGKSSDLVGKMFRVLNVLK